MLPSNQPANSPTSSKTSSKPDLTPLEKELAAGAKVSLRRCDRREPRAEQNQAPSFLRHPVMRGEENLEGHMVAMLVELAENLAENPAIAQRQQSGDILEQESFRPRGP